MGCGNRYGHQKSDEAHLASQRKEVVRLRPTICISTSIITWAEVAPWMGPRSSKLQEGRPTGESVLFVEHNKIIGYGLSRGCDM